MKKNIYIFIIVLIITVCCGICASAYDYDTEADFYEDTVIAVTKARAGDILSLFSFDAAFGDLAVESADNLDITGGGALSLFSVDYEAHPYEVTLAEKGRDSVLDALEYLNTLPNIEYAQPNYIYELLGTPNDSYYSRYQKTYMELIGADKIWDMNIDCSDVVVAVIDSGMQLDHPDLKANLWTNPGETSDGADTDGNNYKDDLHGWDVRDNDNDPTDEDPASDSSITTVKSRGHGTHVSGIVSAVTGNRKGVASLAGDAKIMPIRVFYNGSGSTADIYKGIAYVQANKKYVSIVNNSYGTSSYGTYDTLVKNAIKACSDILFVCAAGNDGKNNNVTSVFPANLTTSFNNVISIASTDYDASLTAEDGTQYTFYNDNLSSYSNYGTIYVDMGAPGNAIISTMLSSGYQYMSGTSMACPMVASAAAVMKAVYPEMTAAEMKAKLKSSADSVSSLTNKTISGGRLNVYEAVLTHATAVSLEDITLEVGESALLSSNVTPSNTTDTVSWKSSDSSIAEVDDSGKVTAIGAGVAEITVTYTGTSTSVSGTCSVTVTEIEETPTVTAEPPLAPTAEPTTAPATEQTSEPTFVPTSAPTSEPTVLPTVEPTSAPTANPTAAPTAEPTSEPTVIPTVKPTTAPTVTAIPSPTAATEIEPTIVPTAAPTVTAIPSPTTAPTAEPTKAPAEEPTTEPTDEPAPIASPIITAEPTELPDITKVPVVTAEPTAEPTEEPLPEPSDRVEFSWQEDDSVLAVLVFEKTVPPPEENIRLYIAYKEDGVLKGLDMLTVSGMKAVFNIPGGLEDCDIYAYVWDENMTPLMEVTNVNLFAQLFGHRRVVV